MEDYPNINRVTLCGEVCDAPVLSHVNHGESFYRLTLCVRRLSGQCDQLPVIASAQLVAAVEPGDSVCVNGQLRSFNNKSGVGSRLILSVFAYQLYPLVAPPQNRIQLSGVICKPPTVRRTPLGRSICDVILAINRRYGRADYLPCIAWGIVAQQVGQMQVGQRLSAEGRIQSRVYSKNTGSQTEQRTAYEVSIMHPASPEDFDAPLED
jgi:single-strand DNA-binding protein